MHYVYILQLSNKQFYTGLTKNLKRRHSEHQNCKVISTRKYCPVKLIFYEAFLIKSDAQKRERYFKTSKGKTTIKLMLKDYLKR